MGLRTIPDVLEPVTVRGLQCLERERRAAEPLLAALSRGERSRADLSASERRLLTGAPMIDHLLRESFALRYQDPQEMVVLAERALQLAESLPTRRYGARVLANLRARAWAELGNALRVAEELNKAQDAMVIAARKAQQGTGDKRLAARLADLAASLLSDLGEFPKALDLLSTVRAIYGELQEGSLLARALVSTGVIQGHNDEPEQATATLLQALELLKVFWDPQLEGIAKHSMAVKLTDLGNYEAARRVLKTPVLKTSSYRHRRDRLKELRRYWLEGKIAAGLREYGRAETAFHIARLGFHKKSKHGDAALVSLDLALMFAKQGKRLQVIQLAKEMIATFKRLGIAREAIASLLLLQRSCGTPTTSLEAIAAQVQTIAAVVAELQRSGSRRGRTS